MESTFWRAKNPLFFFFGVPLLFVCTSFLVVTNVPRSLIPLNILIQILCVGAFAVFVPSFLYVRSSSKIDDDRAEARAPRYATLIARLQSLRWLQFATTGCLVLFALGTNGGRTIYQAGNPLLTICVSILVIYTTLLNLVLVPISIFHLNPLLVTRVNLIAEANEAGRKPSFISAAITSFNKSLKPQTRNIIIPTTANDALRLSQSERRTLALRLASAAKASDYAGFLQTLAWSLGKNVDEIVEPASLDRDIKRLVEKWGPLIKLLYYLLRIAIEAKKVAATASYSVRKLIV